MIFSRAERTIAFRYLRARRREGFISVISIFSFLGIMLGVATLIVVMAVMDGFRAELLGRILGINSHIMVTNRDRDVPNYLDVIKKLRTMDGVADVTPIINGQVLASANENHVGAQVKGITREDLQRKNLISRNILLGSLDEFDTGGGVIIGQRMSEMLRILPGDVITLISPQTSQTFMGSVPRLKEYRVIGVFEIGMFEYDASTIFMPLADAQLYFRLPDSVSSIEVMAADPEASTALAMNIEEAFNDRLAAIDWKQTNAHFFESLKVERNVMFLILTLIILVAAFNIISGLIMLVNDKARDIAILRTMGATSGMVMRIFFMCGAAIGVVGSVAGFLLGVGFALNIEDIRRFLEGLTGTNLFAAEIYFLSKLPADVQTEDVITILCMAISLSFVATLYPSWRASRVQPADGIRSE